MIIRPFDYEKDKEAAGRIWREVGWIEKDKDKSIEYALSACDGMVAEIAGQAECIVVTLPGTVRYIEQDLRFCCLTGVTTSRIARKQGLAGKLAARAVANGAAAGALVSGLGMFEQGFYNQLGFGTGGYEIWVTFDPAQLTVDAHPRIPRRCWHPRR